VEGIALLVVRNDEPWSVPITTVAEAARTVGVEPGVPAGLYTPSTPLEPDAPLTVDEAAAGTLGSWYELADAALRQLLAGAPDGDAASDVQLWPEHFDLAADLGAEDRGARGTFGASAGDANHAVPYLYVTRWSDTGGDAYWNDTAFDGASLAYPDLARSADPVGMALDFFERGRAVITRDARAG
jgi:hypothetical protein